MNSNKVIVQVPMTKEMQAALKRRAKDMGFDTVPAYIRFWVTAETSGSLNPRGLSIYYDLSSPKAQALRYCELILAQRQDAYSTHAHLIYLAKKIQKRELEKLFKTAGMRIN